MKKYICSIVVLFLVLLSANNAVTAEEKDTKTNLTEEPSIPLLERGEERELWIGRVVEYNEGYYKQKVQTWYETETSYVIVFAKREEPVLVGDEIFYGVDKVEYIKPECVKDNTKGTRVTYNYKFTYYYGASGSYQTVGQRNASAYNLIKDLLINIASTVNSVVGQIMQAAAQVGEALLDGTKPASLIVYNQYFYYNKVCSVKPSTGSYWYPTCQIGKRYAFTKEEYSVYLTGGFRRENVTYLHTWDGYSVPPLSGQYVEELTKPHFNDYQWMQDKARETMTTGGYVDVY
ncbi:MAG: hypothetical protein IIU06_00500, partial [Erysipelotrichales bacterium]|nr:hypothetical protein [Erysipelotrichales bacterium]